MSHKALKQVTPRERRVSRNVLANVNRNLAIVTPRERRRNIIVWKSYVDGLVTPRERRVSRNVKYVLTVHRLHMSRLARGV